MSICMNYATVFTPEAILTDSAVIISDDGHIEYVGPMESAPRTEGLTLDLRGRMVIPGLIDVHVHFPDFDLDLTHLKAQGIYLI